MIKRKSGMTKEDENAHTELPDGRPLGLRGGHSEHVCRLEEQAMTMYKLLKRALIALEDDGYMDAGSRKLRADISAVLAKVRGK